MFRLAVLLTLAASVARADGIDVPVTVTAAGQPAAGVDVWLVPSDATPSAAFAHAATDAEGRVLFGKDLIGRLWDEGKYPQLIALDREGRLGAVRLIYPGFDPPPYTVKLMEARNVPGRVVDAAGKPVAKAVLAVRAFELRLAGNDFADTLRLPADVHDRYRCVTDADGRFTIRAVPPAARVHADASAAGLATMSFDWDPAQVTDLTLPPGTAVVGRVVGTEDQRGGRRLTLGAVPGRPSPYAKKPPLAATFLARATTQPDGSFRFPAAPPGKHALDEEANKNAATFLEARSVEVAVGRDAAVPDWPLVAMRKLAGRVIDGDGRGVPGVRVQLNRYRDAGGPFGRQLVASDAESTTDADGRFESYVRPRGTVGAQFVKVPDGYAHGVARDVVLDDAAAAELPPLQLLKVEPVVVRVVDTAGRPVAGALVSASGPSYGVFASRSGKPIADAAGEIRLPFTDRGEAVTLRAIAGDAVSLPLPFDPSTDAGPVTLTVAPANAFRFKGRLLDTAGQPVPDVRVTVFRSVRYRSRRQPGVAGSGVGGEHVVTDTEGRFAAGPFVPGDHYHVIIKPEGFRSTQSPQVEATAGATHDFGTLMLTRINVTVRGRVVDAAGKPVAGAKVVNSGDGLERLVTASDAAGRFELTGLAAGPAHVVAFANGFRPGRTVADASKPAEAVITLLRADVPDLLPPHGIDTPAVRAAARDLLEKVWAWQAGRTLEVDKLLIGYMARIDRDAATRWGGKPPEPTLEQLADTDVDDALARIAAGEARLVGRDLLKLTVRYVERDPVKATRFASEMVAKARAADARHRHFRMADAGWVLARLGRADAGRALVEEVAADAEKLPATGWDAYIRGHVAGRLAVFDLARAERLIAPIPPGRDRDRYRGMIANALAESDPEAAARQLDAIDDSFARGTSAATAAYRAARRDPEAGVRLAARGAGSSFQARGLAWCALAAAERDRAVGHRLIDRAFAAVHDRGLNDLGYTSTGAGWGETAGQIVLVARAIDYPDQAALVAHVLAERPTADRLHGDANALAGNVALALFLADTDRTIAKELLDVADPKRDGMRASRIREREVLSAWALIDPVAAAPRLAAALEKRKAAGKPLTEYDDLIGVLDLMTAGPDERRRALGRRIGSEWPAWEDVE